MDSDAPDQKGLKWRNDVYVLTKSVNVKGESTVFVSCDWMMEENRGSQNEGKERSISKRMTLTND